MRDKNVPGAPTAGTCPSDLDAEDRAPVLLGELHDDVVCREREAPDGGGGGALRVCGFERLEERFGRE
jgi:hypothetical protein